MTPNTLAILNQVKTFLTLEEQKQLAEELGKVVCKPVAKRKPKTEKWDGWTIENLTAELLAVEFNKDRKRERLKAKQQ